MQNEFSKIRTLVEYLETYSPTNEIQKELIHPDILIHLENILTLEMIYDTFFISSETSGKIFKSLKYNGIYILIQEDEKKQKHVYLVSFKDYNILLLYHYLWVLKNDREDYLSFNKEKSLIWPINTLDAFSKQIDFFETICQQFQKISEDSKTSSYEYISYFTYTLSLYAGIRTSVLGNAESKKDSTHSHNFLLYKQSESYSSYARDSSYIINSYEAYIMNLIIYDNKKDYGLTLTRSCMSSINLLFLFWLQKKKKSILVLGTPFHETSRVMESYFPKENISHINFDEIHSKKMEDIMIQNPPDAIIVDVTTLELEPKICNKEVFLELIEQLKKHNNCADILLDVTAKYIFLNEYLTDMNHDIFFVASLSKYFYKGVDLGFGGYLMHPQYLNDTIGLLCQNTGSIISHHDVLKIPIIAKSTHLHIADTLQEKLKNIGTILGEKKQNKEISIYFSNGRQHEKAFCGSYIHLCFSDINKMHYLEEHGKKIIDMIITAAKAKNIDLAYGISYGYTHTRFTTLNIPEFGTIGNTKHSYIRISIGYMSQESEIVELIKIIQKILISFIPK